MAASDYTQRGGGTFCTVASIVGPLVPTANAVQITGLSFDNVDNRVVGMLAMIGSELVRVDGISNNSVAIGRGVGDTVPVRHESESKIWFFDTDVGTDKVEYFGSQTVAVKVLPRTLTKIVPTEASPPNNVVFNSRFIRPYPPAQVKVNGGSFDEEVTLDLAHPDLVITWVGRNRVSQADQLVAFDEPAVTPEPGTTYQVRLFNAAGVLKKTLDAGAANTITINRATVALDLGVSDEGVVSAYLHLESVRDGYTSYQPVRINFNLDTSGLGNASGWGISWGASWA